ncbi:MAG TPA: hypothetical protein VKU02_16785 [Gemmataceae bacterium]|nr:hypothetical protein [Gemmataceae bacterium]
MKMQHTYGIFDDEANHIIDLVRRHAPLAQIRGTACPVCGSPMAVEFMDDGNGFQVYCEGSPLHISKHQDITEPPPWWPQCVIPPTDSTWYWREWHSFDGSGNLTMKVSGWRADGGRWSGQLECATGDPDYAFWRWVLLQSGCTSDRITETELAELRARFARTT